ncbi:MAG TPA: alpha/beta fold hydrolase [Thermoanaerobaculia bacterium]|nr:alpha/beta fold hydrolase [Thermoanaerobaculia bacterium]
MILAAALFASATLTPCRVQEIDARCTTIEVRESSASARKILLNVVVVPATGPAKRDAIFVLAGGPGQPATALLGFATELFAAARKERDIVFLEQRGTGKSNGLFCDLGDDLADLMPLPKMVQCRDELMKRADLRAYTTKDAVRDLESVRHALGYRKVDFFGTSYGTRMALEYTRRHRERVRAIVLKGVVAPSLRYTVDPALATQASLERVEARAPALRGDLETALAHLPSSVTKDTLAVQLRNGLHSIGGAEEVPKLVQRLAAGDWTPLIDAQRRYRAGLSKGLGLGMYFSVTCAEDIWRVSDAEAKRLTAGTLPGDYWHRQLARVCRIWPHAEPQREVATPFRSRVPALIVSGAYDPVTPPRFGDEVARMFPNSRHIVVANGSHSFERLEGCVDVMMAKFIEDPDPAKVDASCVAKIPAPRF